jgi:hypothetical protein
MIFCTTATPHLGIASHTYVPLPKFAEKIVGSILSQTGQDFFRQDDHDLIFDLATNYHRFLKPLSMFRKRIAYINAFRTDFQVPQETAGFFSTFSSYPHNIVYYFPEERSDTSRSKQESFLLLVLQTETNINILQEDVGYRRNADLYSIQDQICYMSNKLDALGWTKVILDVRNLIPLPSIDIPWRTHGTSREELDTFIRNHVISTDNPRSSTLMLRNIQSKDLARLLSKSERIVIPMGHTVMVANSKNQFNSFMNARGKPIMDMLAKDMIDFILQPESKTVGDLN